VKTRLSTALLSMTLLALPGVVLGADPQATCINALNKDFRNASNAQAGDNASCVKDAQRGTLGSLTARDCLTADRRGKVAKAVGTAFAHDFNLCNPSPSFGPMAGEAGAERAAEKERLVVEGLFGPDLDAALLTGRDNQSCQAKVLGAANKCGDTRLKEFVACKKAGLKSGSIGSGSALQDACLGVGAGGQSDPNGKIAKACNDKLSKEITGCDEDGVDLAAAVPGCGTDSTSGTFACVESRIDCEMCKFLNDADNLARNCDLFDDGSANGSCESVCGNGIPESGEQCDDGNGAVDDGCRPDCTAELCGDGIVDINDDCDDGNTNSGDGCSASCDVESGFSCAGEPSSCGSICGDGLIRAAEACDDGNLNGSDGCSATCTISTGYSCTGEPSGCTPICGDGLIRGSEACDDGDTSPGDGCSATCTIEGGFICSSQPSNCVGICGDGLVRGAETCDDGGTTGGDGCSVGCATETGYSCTGEPSSCDGICGDGLIFGTENCDDGDASSGDGCSSGCDVEAGFSCFGTPSNCAGICGDGLIRGGEECDDAGTVAGDGCGPSCLTEPGFTCLGEPSVCSGGCGDGDLDAGEDCDDGNVTNNDGCGDTCEIESGYECSGQPSSCNEICGDGLIVGGEGCDDGGTSAGDGCSAACQVETGFTCGGQPSSCSAICGDGLVLGAETCDDGDTSPGDGCGSTCLVESGWECSGQPSTCTLLCGNGTVNPPEECDDGPGNSSLPDANCRTDCTLAGCGDSIVDPGDGEECDLGPGNSNAPDAGCRLDCDFPTCGDGIVDPGLGEECEDDADCGGGDICTSCMCETPLGSWFFDIRAGNAGNCPPDSSTGSFIKARGVPTGGIIGSICSITEGNFSSDDDFELVGGVPDANGIAEVEFARARVIRVQEPDLAGTGWICVRAESNGPGWVDCDGGSNANVSATVDSNGAAAPPPPSWDASWVTAPSGVSNSGPGAAIIPVLMKVLRQATPCPGPSDAVWNTVNTTDTVLGTGTVTSTITESQQCTGGGGIFPSCPASPYVVTLSGTNLSCANWSTQTLKGMAAPLFILGEDFGTVAGQTFGLGDIALVARLITLP